MAKIKLPEPQQSMVKATSSAAKNDTVEGESPLSVALKRRRQSMASKKISLEQNTDELGNLSPEELNDGK